jgi:hypothetical protein
MAIAKWATPSSLSSDVAGSGAGTLNSNPGLANGAVTSVLADIVNTGSALDLNVYFELVIASMTVSSGGSISIGLVEKLSSNNYAKFSASVMPVEFAIRAGVAATQAFEMRFDMRLLPGTWGIVVLNNLGAALPTTSNTLKYATYNESVA